jgi:hypothetical protein
LLVWPSTDFPGPFFTAASSEMARRSLRGSMRSRTAARDETEKRSTQARQDREGRGSSSNPWESGWPGPGPQGGGPADREPPPGSAGVSRLRGLCVLLFRIGLVSHPSRSDSHNFVLVNSYGTAQLSFSGRPFRLREDMASSITPLTGWGCGPHFVQI